MTNDLNSIPVGTKFYQAYIETWINVNGEPEPDFYDHVNCATIEDAVAAVLASEPNGDRVCISLMTRTPKGAYGSTVWSGFKAQMVKQDPKAWRRANFIDNDVEIPAIVPAEV
jgi:hypothetical protein